MANWFVRSRPTTQWATGVAKSLGDRVVATSAVAYLGIHFECTTAGTTGGGEPTWNTTVGGTTADNTVTWTTRGSANTWAANAAYVSGDRVHSTTSATAARQTYVYECTTGGTSGGSEPAWVTTTPDTSTTTDNTVTWTLRKPTTWDNSHPYLTRIDGDVSGSGKLAAGDTIYVSKNHLETSASTVIFNPPGTWQSPNVVVCVDDTGDPSSPTTPATTARVETTGSTTITIDTCIMDGVNLRAGDGANTPFIDIARSSGGWVILKNCEAEIRGTGVVGAIEIGTQGSHTLWENVTAKFSSIGQRIDNDSQSFRWINSATPIAGTVPNILIDTNASSVGSCHLENLDLSSLNTRLFNADWSDLRQTWKAINCRLHASVIIDDGFSTSTLGNTIDVINCNSGAVNYYRYMRTEHGTLTTETTLVMTDGATDGVTPVSWKVVTNATPTFSVPFRSPVFMYWNESIGGAITASVEILHDSATNLKDDEVWVELSYLSSASYPLGVGTTDRKTDILATGTDQTASSVTWTTTGMANPNKQKLSVTFTPQMVGFLSASVCVAKVSKTLYINPQIILS